MKIRPASSRAEAFTLIEVCVAMAVSVVMFGAAIETSVVLQRSFTEADNESSAVSDEERVIDYIARDLRCAYTVAVSSSNQTLTVTIPDCYSSYDAQGNPVGSQVSPTITSNVVNYNDPTKPVTVCYYVSGSQLLRQQTVGSTGVTTATVVSTDVINLQSVFANLTNIVTVTLTFNPQFSLVNAAPSASAQAGTQMTAAISVRNVRRD